jgi:hypothetical protein
MQTFYTEKLCFTDVSWDVTTAKGYADVLNGAQSLCKEKCGRA